MTVLQVIRIYGPCDAFTVQDKTGAPLDIVVATLWTLRCEGLACSTTATDWDATEAGDQAFKASLRPEPAPRRESRRWFGRARV